MNTYQFLEKYYEYYLSLESDFVSVQRYVTFDKKNYNTFSIEFVKQYQTICSEIDVICKEYCCFLYPNQKANKINGYRNLIFSKRDSIIDSCVKMINSNKIEICPWKDCRTDTNETSGDAKYSKAPKWWKKYNQVKHERTSMDDSGNEFLTYANFENTLNALAALYIIEMYFYKDISLNEENMIPIPSKKSNLFYIEGWEPNYTMTEDLCLVNV